RVSPIIALDRDLRRISLSLKSDAASRIEHNGMGGSSSGGSGSAGGSAAKTGAKKIVVVRKGAAGGSGAGAGGARGENRGGRGDGRNNPVRERRAPRENFGSDDGMSYNPFAALLKK
ncbi:MAG: RNA-binding transcriptional accessory protein, partial [Treponema sp.]|nr:RNA-binding transcriptional accessory protein [Treponema sp.]